jgi:BMFP domain-containing protein YqiC
MAVKVPVYSASAGALQASPLDTIVRATMPARGFARSKQESFSMTQTTGRFFDELGKLITDAAGAADGVRKEVEGVVRTQAERVLRELDIVQREEFEAVKAMAQKARAENERLVARIAELEAIVLDIASEGAEPRPPRPIKRTKPKPSY